MGVKLLRDDTRYICTLADIVFVGTSTKFELTRTLAVKTVLLDFGRW